MSITVELITAAQFNALVPNRAFRAKVRSMLDQSIEWTTCFAGHRFDHYDVTPATPDDMATMRRANGGNLNWVALPVAVQPEGSKKWYAFGQNTRMHASRQGGGNPGPEFPSRSDDINKQTKPGTWDPGGHSCLYPHNGAGGADNATNTNRHARAEANALAYNGSNGRQARAAAYEAWFRGGGTVPKQEPVAVNYAVEAMRGPINVRTEPSAAKGDATVAGQIYAPRRFRIDTEQIGPDGNTTTKWGKIADDPQHSGKWVALRLTMPVAESVIVDPPAPAQGGESYIVQPDDSLSVIGQKTGRDWQAIAERNNITPPYIIQPKQELILPPR